MACCIPSTDAFKRNGAAYGRYDMVLHPEHKLRKGITRLIGVETYGLYLGVFMGQEQMALMLRVQGAVQLLVVQAFAGDSKECTVWE